MGGAWLPLLCTEETGRTHQYSEQTKQCLIALRQKSLLQTCPRSRPPPPPSHQRPHQARRSRTNAHGSKKISDTYPQARAGAPVGKNLTWSSPGTELLSGVTCHATARTTRNSGHPCPHPYPQKRFWLDTAPRWALKAILSDSIWEPIQCVAIAVAGLFGWRVSPGPNT